MTREPRHATILAIIAAVAFWFTYSLASDSPEPWDASGYPLALSGAIFATALCGYGLPRRAWRWGVIAILSQLPVLLARAEMGPLWIVGAAILVVESVPAILAGIMAARLRRRA